MLLITSNDATAAVSTNMVAIHINDGIARVVNVVVNTASNNTIIGNIVDNNNNAYYQYYQDCEH